MKIIENVVLKIKSGRIDKTTKELQDPNDGKFDPILKELQIENEKLKAALVEKTHKQPWYSFVYQDGFKTRAGVVIYSVGEYVDGFWGALFKLIGTALAGAGLGHSVLKSSPKHNGNEGIVYKIYKALAWIYNTLVKLITQKKR